ncbi:hypothetical protein [Hyphobacterium sp.]|jgi:hypothetical protein|uniref:hypothetical protein n=1 Tax=Hyphobacterium sp. TaxID=2004662 RepID=UPI003BABBFEA
MFRMLLVMVLAIGSLAEAQTTREQRIDGLFDVIDENAVGFDPSTSQFHMAAQALIYVGREDLFREFVEQAPFLDRSNDCPVTGTLADFRDTVIDGAAQTRIVIVNEAHTNARHRLLPAELASWLAPLGYRYFAAETFSAESLEMRSENEVLAGTGTYSFEPIFARSLRQIADLEYSFVAYEQRSDQRTGDHSDMVSRIHEREIAQTQNLIAAVFDHDPDARVLIHVGHAHVLERPHVGRDGSETRWFANRLAEATGIDPITIDQTECAADSTISFANGSETRKSGLVDHFIAHPPVEFERNRPTWRREIGDIDTDIPAEFLSDSERIIVEAHPAGGSTEEVAIDRLMLFPGEDIPLLLPPGRYDLRSWTADGLLGGPVEITVGE